MRTLSAVRAFVSGEGLWSKAQKNAIFSLQTYRLTHNEKDFEDFLSYLKASDGDRQARIELFKDNPRFDVIRKGFLEGGIHFDDILPMSNLILRFHKITYLKRALQIWGEADELMIELKYVGLQYHQLIASSESNIQKINDSLNQIKILNQKLTTLEDDFSYTLGEGSRWLERVILSILTIAVFIVESIGISLTYFTSRSIALRLKKLRDGAIQVENGNFSQQIQIEEKDELGSVAQAINKMSNTIHRSQEELRASQQLYQSMVESVRDYLIFSLDSGGLITSWNRNAKTLTGYRTEEIIGKHFSIFYLAEEINKSPPHVKLNLALQLGRYESTDLLVKKDQTRFYANTVLSPMRDENEKLIGYVKVIRDLSTENRVKELEDSIQIRDEFLSIASHDLKTPVTSLHLNLQILERLVLQLSKTPLETSQIERINKSLLVSKSSTKRLVQLLNELFDVTQIRAGKLTIKEDICDLSSLTQEIIEQFAEEMEQKGVSFQLNLKNNIVGSWDKVRIQQVISNLVSNAIKYGNNKPIEVTIDKDESKRIAAIRVRDQGQGIPIEFQSKIFKRFERATESDHISGLGLGLYITHQIVTAHRGTIFVQSEPERGSLFTVELPL